MMKLSSQSDGMTPFLTMSLARSTTNLAPVSPDAFSISATIPEGPAALPVPWTKLLFIRLVPPGTHLILIQSKVHTFVGTNICRFWQDHKSYSRKNFYMCHLRKIVPTKLTFPVKCASKYP